MPQCSQDFDSIFMTHLRIDMSENNWSHIDMVADSVGSDACQYSWVVREA